MSLYSISGVGCNCGGCSGCDGDYIGGRRKRQERRARRKARRTGINCKGARVKAVALAPARNAYLALVRLNFKKFAVKLAKATSTKEGREKVHAKWCKLGGNGVKLQNAINKAYNKYKRKHKLGEIGYMDTDGTIGVVSVSALLATALPIITALTPLLKQFGGEKGQEIAEGAEQGAELARQYTSGEEAQQPAEQQPAEQGAEVGGVTLNPYLIGGGVLLAYLLLRKKK